MTITLESAAFFSTTPIAGPRESSIRRALGTWSGVWLLIARACCGPLRISSVIHVDPATGRQLPESKFLPRVYRSASFSSDGSVYLGEHMCAEAPPPGIEQLTTVEFPRLPDSGVLGYGNIYRYNADWELDKEFEVENAPEPTRFKGVTHSTLHPGEQFITYTTELGKRVMRYDVQEDRQLADLVTYPGKDISNGLFAIAVRYLPDGRLLLTRGQTMEMLDKEGKVMREYALPEYGWSDVSCCADSRYALVSNIFSGIMLKVDLETGEFVGRIDTGQSESRCARWPASPNTQGRSS